MSDPLSVATGIVGIVTAVAQVSILLTRFTKSTIAAPQQAQVVLAEVSDIGEILSQLQSFLLGRTSPKRSRASLLRVDKVVNIVSGCVLTFSELERLLDEMKTDDLDVLDRLKWARKESVVVDLIRRLQNHKASLSLVLNILNGQTMAEARDSMDRLHALVERFYEEMSNRVRALEVVDIQNGGDADMASVDDTESIATIRVHPPDVRYEATTDRQTVHFDFLHDLQQSRVYRRNQAFRRSVFSALTNSVCSVGWSLFSEMSLSEVSNISVINLPITDRETFNPQRSSQTWSAKLNEGASAGPHINDLRDNQRTQLNKIARKPVPATNSAMLPGRWLASAQTEKQNSFAARPSSRIEVYDGFFQSLMHYKEETPVRMTEEHDKIARKPVPATNSAMLPGRWLASAQTEKQNSFAARPSSRKRALEVYDGFFQSMEHYKEETPVRMTEEYATTITQPPKDDLNPLSTSKDQPVLLSQSDYTIADSVTYACKSCEKRLKEATIFVLVGSRGYILNPPRCSTCGFTIGRDGLFLFDDGSPACFDCTYKCSVCKVRTRSLTIVVGTRAFCETCFKCRDCKERIRLNFNQVTFATSKGFFWFKCTGSFYRHYWEKSIETTNGDVVQNREH